MIQKQGIDVSFAEGLDTKTDPKRVQMGKFLALENTVFNKGGLLQKRNGFAEIASLPDSSYSYLTTFNGNLTAIGTNIAAYSNPNADWVVKRDIQPLSLNVLPVIRNNYNQTQVDVAIAANGLACAVYIESTGSAVTNKYVIFDPVTGQNIVPPALIPVVSGVPTGGMRVFVLGNSFILVFTNVISGTSHLQYVPISITVPTNVGANTDIAAAYAPFSTLSWDGYVVNNQLFIAYNTTSGGQKINVTYLTTSFLLASPTSFAGFQGTMIGVTADTTVPARPIIYISFYSINSMTGYVAAVNTALNVLMAPVEIITVLNVLNITASAINGVVTVFYEVSNAYTYDTSVPTNYINSVSVTLLTSTVSATKNVIRSVGLASKSFIHNGTIYFLTAYQSPFQPTYFLIPGSISTAASPRIAAKLAYQNGGGYLTLGLPSVNLIGDIATTAYLIKDQIQAVNKNTNVPSGTQTAGVYSQTGINLTNFTFGTEFLDTAEIANNLNITGGFLSAYDGYLYAESNFFLYPDMDNANPTDAAAWSTTGGSMAAKPDGLTNTNAYFYQVTYEWTDNQGNAFRSAPSIPIAVTTIGSGTTGSVTLNIPTLRMTLKSNVIKIVIYRWSVGQQIYYQTTSISTPLPDSTITDSVQYVDTNSDATILGNNILYTTGGVLENVNAPASNILALFDTRLWLVDAEDPNLLWYSKQVIESVPVETSDLLTLYVAPTTSTQGSTGPITAMAAMDDKLIIFKQNAIYYVNGTGPDNTGANSQYSPPTYVTSTVGCTDQTSIVLMPTGLMFQSDKGIWLLDRGLGTNYIGAPVENFTIGQKVHSAVNIPETNQVRFTVNSGVTLMYDYYYQQWGSFVGIPGISSCIWNGTHTFINSLGQAFQEKVGQHLDGGNSVLMHFKTGPLRLGDLQNYQRAYFFYLLGTYLSPHKLAINIIYDYESSPSQSLIISPTNYSTPYGSQSPYGQGNPYGGGSDQEVWRVFLQRQRCMAFSIEIQEVFDSEFGPIAGAGLTISGLNIVMGFKKAFRPQPNVNSIG